MTNFQHAPSDSGIISALVCSPCHKFSLTQISTPTSHLRLGAISYWLNSRKALAVITEMFFLCSNYSDISVLLTFKLLVFFQREL